MTDMATETVPHHVDPRQVLDYDLFADPRFEGPGGVPQAMAQLSRDAPDVYWTPRTGGYWVIQGYDAIVDAAKRTDLFSSERMSIPAIPGERTYARSLPLQVDPPDHAAFRLPLAEAFAPTNMMRREKQIRELAIELIDKVALTGRCDFFEAVAEPLPVLIFMDMMGLDRAKFREFRNLVRIVTSDKDQTKRTQAIMQTHGILADVVRERRAKRGEDLVSFLLDLEFDGTPITDDLVLSYANLLFFAGLDTVANAMAFMVRYLAGDPALQKRLRAEPGKIKHAMEEMLRRHAVAPVVRVVTRDDVWRGAAVKQGDMVLLNYPVANLDDRMFAHGATVDIDRERINHIAFGAGPHRCIGRHLARIEINVMLEEWLARVPEFRPDPDGHDITRGGHVLAVEKLPIVWGRV